MRTILRKFLEWVVKEDEKYAPEEQAEPKTTSYEIKGIRVLEEKLYALECYLGVSIHKSYGYKVVKKTKGLVGSASAEKAD